MGLKKSETCAKSIIELIDKQNNLQWSIVSKLTLLIKSEWASLELKNNLESLITQHSEITQELNSLDKNNSLL